MKVIGLLRIRYCIFINVTNWKVDDLSRLGYAIDDISCLSSGRITRLNDVAVAVIISSVACAKMCKSRFEGCVYVIACYLSLACNITTLRKCVTTTFFQSNLILLRFFVHLNLQMLIFMYFSLF